PDASDAAQRPNHGAGPDDTQDLPRGRHVPGADRAGTCRSASTRNRAGHVQSPRLRSLSIVHLQGNLQDVRASTIRANPLRKHPNMAVSNLLVPAGAARNSFQMKTPQKAATIVAPCPSPYEIAKPARPEAMRLKDIPTPQMMPPRMPVRWVLNP